MAALFISWLILWKRDSRSFWHIKRNVSRSFVLLVKSLWIARGNKTEARVGLNNPPVVILITLLHNQFSFYKQAQILAALHSVQVAVHSRFRLYSTKMKPFCLYIKIHQMTLTQQDPEREGSTSLLSFLRVLVL